MMASILRAWLYYTEGSALKALRDLSMQERNDMAAKAQKFADWLALENSREISK